MEIHTVVVCDDNWGISKDGCLPFGTKKEAAHFYRFIADTSHLPPGRKNVLIMGRKTWTEETPADAPQSRSVTYNFLLSKTLKERPKEVDGIVSSVEEFVTLMESPRWKDKIGRIYNIGGGQACEAIYASKYCGRAYMSLVRGDFHCDTFAPNLDKDENFKRVEKSFAYESLIPDGIQKEENGTEWTVNIYERYDKKESSN